MHLEEIKLSWFLIYYNVAQFGLLSSLVPCGSFRRWAQVPHARHSAVQLRCLQGYTLRRWSHTSWGLVEATCWPVERDKWASALLQPSLYDHPYMIRDQQRGRQGGINLTNVV